MKKPCSRAGDIIVNEVKEKVIDAYEKSMKLIIIRVAEQLLVLVLHQHDLLKVLDEFLFISN